MLQYASPSLKPDVKKQLEKLRDEPVNTDGSQDDVLLPITHYLTGLKPDRNGELHWFCPKADAVGKEAAVFLLRLFAYTNDLVITWKKNLIRCLHSCAACIQSLDEAKKSSKLTYFGAFAPTIIAQFWRTFEEWEVQEVANVLKNAGISPQSTKTLKDIPSPVVYHLLSKCASFKDPIILDVLAVHPISVSEWPLGPPPAGIFLLLLHESPSVQTIAKNILNVISEIGIDKILEQHEIVARIITEKISWGSLQPSAPTKNSSIHEHIAFAFPFTSQEQTFWECLEPVIRVFPSALLRSSGLVKAVIGRLHDTGPHFEGVLQCLFQLLHKLNKEMWEGEDEDYPRVVFDSVKDNPTFPKLLKDYNPIAGKPWFLTSFIDFLSSVWDLPMFDDIFAKLVAFMCDELQHERFEKSRPIIMSSAIQIINAVVRKASKSKNESQARALAVVLDIHSDKLIAVVCSRAYAMPEWSATRKHAHTLLNDILSSDVDAVASAIVRLSNAAATTVDASEFGKYLQPIHRQIWQSVYKNLTSSDVELVRLLISLSAKSAKLDKLSARAVSLRFWKHYRGLGKDAQGKDRSPPKSLLEALTSVMNAINSALDVIRDGFLDAVERFSNFVKQKDIRDMLKETAVVQNVMALMLSPVDSLHDAAQALIGQAFDIEDRADCFRMLFDTMPEASFLGIQQYLDRFSTYAEQVSEACSVSKALARCLTDVIEVLGNSPDGLLKNERYLTRANTGSFELSKELPKFWKLMATSIAVIYKRTPHWALYFDNSMMLEWMRDALIFGRDLLARRRAFEGAALFASGQESYATSPRKLSPVGKQMVKDLETVLFELQAWLRLVDQELLYQSFSLLKSLMDCFREVGVPPSDAVLAKLRKFIDANRSSNTKVSFLDAASLADLEMIVLSFDDDDDVVVLPDNVGRKLFASKGKSDAPSRSDGQKAGSSKVASSRRSSDSHKSNALPRDSGPDIEEVIMTTNAKKAQKPLTQKVLPSMKKMEGKSDVAPMRKRSTFEPKYEGRAVPRKPAADSSSSSSSDSEDGESGLAQLARLQGSPVKQAKKPTERRQIKLIDDPMLSYRNPIRERFDKREDARRNALRLKPDITPLHRMILSWDYDHDGAEPPFRGNRPTLMRIPDSFSNHQGYLKVFEPLLMLECWAQIVKSKEETSPEIYEVKISARSFVDDWLDLDLEFKDSIRRDWRLTETDVVLLRNAATGKSIMGKASGFRRTAIGVQVAVRCNAGHHYDPGLNISSIWQLNTVFSLSTLHREFAALMGLPYYDLAGRIFSPHLNDPPHLSQRDVDQAMKSHNVNEPQARAILSAMNTDGFSLIQGPPGTGKTWTICGFVGTFLSSRKQPATAVVVGRQSGPGQKLPKEKVLVCAPSNAAIDEVAKRLKEGVYGSSGNKIIPKVVRIGSDSAINISVKDVSLDALVDNRLQISEDPAKQNIGADVAGLRSEIQAVRTLKEKKQAELGTILNNASKMLALEQEIKDLNTKRMNLSQRLDRLRDQEKSQNRTLDAVRRKVRQEILEDADVICSTLSGAGHECLDQFDFSMVIIDEAAQSIELSSLIPLKYRCRRCIMVGDPQQLPPTVLSPEASKWGYDQSLFLRLQKCRPSAVHLLSIQYRMHPDISVLPSRIFYNCRLEDGPGMAEKTKQPWHSDVKFGVYKFFNAFRGREEPGRIGHSLINREECQLIVALFDRLRRQFSAINFDYRIGIVSMYRAQVAELRRVFRNKFGEEIHSKVDFNTVDGFQGQEKDVIILSCVRAGTSLSSVGFLADTRRMNVAITRSRSSLFIIGNGPTLERSNETWQGIVQDARSRSCYIDLPDTTYFTAPRNANSQQPLPAPPPVKPKSGSKKQEVVLPGGEKLLTPKEMKSLNQSQARKAAAKVDGEGSVSIKTLQKRVHEDDHEKRPAPAVRVPDTNNDSASAQSGSSTSTVQPHTVAVGPPSRPPEDHKPSQRLAGASANDNEKKRRAEKELRAFEQRKKKATSNPFLKR